MYCAEAYEQWFASNARSQGIQNLSCLYFFIYLFISTVCLYMQ